MQVIPTAAHDVLCTQHLQSLFLFSGTQQEKRFILLRFKFLFPEKGIDSSALSRGRLRITEQQLGQTAINDTAIKKWHA